MPKKTRVTRAARNMEERTCSESSEDERDSVVEMSDRGGTAPASITEAVSESRAYEGAAPVQQLAANETGAIGAAAARNPTPSMYMGAPTPFDAERLVTTMMESFVRTQAEANRTLVETLRSFQYGWNPGASTPTRPSASTPAPIANMSGPVSRTGNFSKCTARFDGQSRDAEVLEAFIDAVEIYKECADVSDEHALRGLSMLLTGDAAVWWRGARSGAATWLAALARLRATYGVQQPGYKVLRTIFEKEQSATERADVFVTRLRSLLVKLPYDVPSAMQIDIIYGLLHRRVRKRLPRDSLSNDVEKLVEKARDVEDAIAEIQTKTRDSDTSSNSKTIAPVTSSERKSATTSSGVTTSSKLDSNETNKRPRVRCSVCRAFGHSSNECTKAESKGKQPIRCYGCGQPGVVRSKCEKCGNKSVQAKPSDFNVVSGDFFTTTETSHPTVSVSILGKNGVAIVDTGATHSVASPTLYSILEKGGVKFRDTPRVIGLADGSRHDKIVKIGSVQVTLGNREVVTDFMVFPDDDTRTLLGRDFIANAGIVLDIAQLCWHFADSPTQKFLFVQSYVLNETSVMQADVEDVSLRSDEGTELKLAQRAILNDFLETRVSQFATSGPATDFAVHRIKVSSDQEPLASAPYRLSPPKREALEKEVEKLLRADVIEECESPWASNVVLVKKKDGSFRLCVDYRKLNAVTEPDRYPLPRIEDILHAAKTSRYMTTLDLRAGYFQVCVSPEDRDKTAFVSPLGTYRFKRMPMGLRNSGATFQRLIDRFKSNLPGITILAYLDDLIILSDESFEQHLADLKSVFDRLAMFDLRVNREKSHFARESVKFLGHIILPGGIHVDPEKTAAISEIPTPLNVKHLKCFLQTSSWFRRFIPNYADVAKPLTTLLKKASVWQWGPDQQDAFEHIKRLLVTAPILRQADETMPFVLRTDSSGYALGAALLQGVGPDERPIEYASRLLTTAEKNYSTTEREALAVVWAVSKFRGYIDGVEVVVKSDHQPLRWLMNMKSPSGRLARWALCLQEYNLKIEYTPGKANVIADTLSRPACAEDADCDVCCAVVDMPSRSQKDTRENQLLDPEVRKIVEALESDDPFRGRVWADKGYVLNDGVLYRYGPENEEDDSASLVVPEQEREKIMVEYHDAPTAGHLGAERTLQRLMSKYYWPGMRSYVSQYVKNCVTCQRYKADNRKPAGLLQTPASARRFEVLSVDLFGPLPETTQGNRWVLIVEDTCTRWVELFPLTVATSEECAKVLVAEVFLRYGVPRRLVSDNGVQFISEVMQQTCHAMGITQSFTSYYHPEANPVERKNRDLKPQLAILVGRDHNTWDTHLSAVRFAMNSAITSGTGYSPAYLSCARELRAPADVLSEMRVILNNDHFIGDITTYLKKISTTLVDARDVHEKAQAAHKKYADENRRPAPDYEVGDLVLLKTQGPNDIGKGQTTKFIPRRDGPYRIQAVVSASTYVLERISDGTLLGKYHASAITPFVGHIQAPVQEKRKRGRPRKANPNAGTHVRLRGGDYSASA